MGSERRRLSLGVGVGVGTGKSLSLRDHYDRKLSLGGGAWVCRGYL